MRTGWRAATRWSDTERARRGLFVTWIEPVCGAVLVRDWMATDAYCRTGIEAVRNAGRAPATVQNVGALMRKVVTTAHDRSWASLDAKAALLSAKRYCFFMISEAHPAERHVGTIGADDFFTPRIEGPPPVHFFEKLLPTPPT